MTKQEFLAFSLPYGLKCQFLNSTYDYTPMKYVFEFKNNGEKSIPILRPLSMFKNSGFDIQDEILVDKLIQGESIDTMPFYLIKTLVENNFDISRLIDEDEAIAVTEDFNPYK